jgi:alcohol dehydrogenase (cytochrome c)
VGLGRSLAAESWSTTGATAGRSRGLINVARDGYLWFLERTSGKINFVEGTPFVKQNVFKSLDPKTGRPDVDPVRQPGTGKEAEFCPSHWGGKNWPPIAYSPKTRMIYIPANENLCSRITGRPVAYTVGRAFTGATTTLLLAPGADHIGEVQAWNVDTGKRAWTHSFGLSINWGPNPGDRRRPRLQRRHRRIACSARSTRQPARCCGSSRPTRASSASPRRSRWPGRQYIAVQAGWGIDARAMQGSLNRSNPGKFPEVPEGGAVWVFEVK